jgi:hypothetical protein
MYSAKKRIERLEARAEAHEVLRIKVTPIVKTTDRQK